MVWGAPFKRLKGMAPPQHLQLRGQGFPIAFPGADQVHTGLKGADEVTEEVEKWGENMYYIIYVQMYVYIYMCIYIYTYIYIYVICENNASLV